MTEKATGSSDLDPSTCYALSAESYARLCSVRDELLLFATRAARPKARDREMLVCRNALAHCFEHLAKRVDDVVNMLMNVADIPSEPGDSSTPISRN